MPYGGNLHISKALTNISIQYTNENFIADRVLQSVPVLNESDQYYVYNRDFRIDDTLRQRKSPANMATWGVSTSSYSLDEYALADLIPDRDRQNTDAPLSLDIDTTEFLMQKILRQKEKIVSDLLFTTTSWANNQAGTTNTSWRYNTTTSAPIQQVLSATGVIIRQSGIMPNKLVVGWSVFEALKENNNVYGRIQYVERAILTEEILASVFDVAEFIVGKSYYDSSIEGMTETMTAIWGDKALLGYFNPRVGLRQVTSAVLLNSSQNGAMVKAKKWREEKLAGDMVEVSTMYVPKTVATQCAFLFSSVTTV